MKQLWLLLVMLLSFGERLIAQDPYLQALGNSHFEFLFDEDKWQIEKIVTENHPYENPQWITYKVNGGKNYIEWVNDPNQ